MKLIKSDMKLTQLWKNGPLWADRNLGAEEPEEPGLFFTWGSTTGLKMLNGVYPESPFDDMDRKTLKDMGVIDGIHLSKKHDAAYCMLGESFRLPTGTELKYLIEKCDWKYVHSPDPEHISHYFVVTGKGEFSDNSIVLPLGEDFYSGGCDILYWSATSGTNAEDARALSPWWSAIHRPFSGNCSRNSLMMIRPVSNSPESADTDKALKKLGWRGKRTQ